MDREIIKVNGNIHESKRVNVVFDILHVFFNGPISLLRAGKILAMDHDPFTGERGICLLEGGSQARDVVEVERNRTSKGETNPIIALRSN